MKRNKLIMLIFILLNFACQTGDLLLVDTQGLQKVEVNSVNLQITTSVAVKCKDFENYFETNNIHSRTLADSSQWNTLINEINRVIAKGEKFNEGADVRMKIKLYYDSYITTICIGNTLISMNGNNYINDDLFREFIIKNFEK